ncbi:hypothetical protein AGDE_08617 [Angomonas deanei]|uniref:Uncharacterized protein n=1 Tax=Angomonas deanei TaxID=59799 RepID=A0A7G2CLR4_9TRYP|nr:hypothetical protein AGDE_08617 [Angomonas deanei]CAD2219202.1 hypothetical protein, conserved [Angomonas deanei]|eukprot:EPY32516.1 hypothetical protein AGDE_08617 [Angomonas deanei]
MDSPDCIHVSLQRWEDHVIPVESSVLGDTAAMTPPQDVSLFQPPFTRYKDLLAQSTSGRNERERTALRERYRTFTFDTIIGNSDRWVGHNLFVLAPAGRPTPRVLFIDQGSGFGQEGLLPCNPFHAASFRAALPTGTGKRGASAPLGRLNPQGTCDPRPPMCVGHRRTLDTLREVVQFSQLYYNTHEVFHHRSPVSVSHYKRFHATLLLNWTAQAPVRGYFQPEHPEEQTLPLFTVADVRNAALSSEESTKVGRSLAFLLSLRLPPQVLTVLTEDMIEAAGRRVWAVLAQDQRCAHQYPLLQNTF